jgi:Spy/CpxP family protein refolding chaperone
MKARMPGWVLLFVLTAFGASAMAQGPGRMPPPGPPPGGGPPAGMPGQPGAPGGQSAPAGARNQPPPRSADAAHGGFQFGPVGRWWDDKTVIQTVGLSKDQQKRMDSIFNASKPAIQDSYKTFLSEQNRLNKLSKDPAAPQVEIFAAIDAVAKARTELQKATTLMLLQIRQQMAPDQIVRLEKLK